MRLLAVHVHEEPQAAHYRLQVVYLVESKLGPEHQPPEGNVFVTTTTPPIVPCIGEKYFPAAEDPPAGDTCIPWNVIDVEHTVWVEHGRLVFEAIVFVERDAKEVTDVARQNAERGASEKLATGKRNKSPRLRRRPPQ